MLNLCWKILITKLSIFLTTRVGSKGLNRQNWQKIADIFDSVINIPNEVAYLPRSCSSRNKGLRPKTRSWASRREINDGPTSASGALALLRCAWASVCVRKTKVDVRERERERETERERQGRQGGGKEGCREVVEPWRGAIPARERRTEPLRFNVQIERSRELLRASRRRTSSTLSTPQGRCTPLNLT